MKEIARVPNKARLLVGKKDEAPFFGWASAPVVDKNPMRLIRDGRVTVQESPEGIVLVVRSFNQPPAVITLSRVEANELIGALLPRK